MNVNKLSEKEKLEVSQKVVTIHVYDNNSGDYLHCFDGSSSPV